MMGVLVGCGGPTDPSSSGSGVVSQVLDGDTIEVDGLGRVRLVGVDAPEVGECGSQGAEERLSALVLGREVQLVAGGQGDTDRYGRLLRYVEVDGVDVGLVLVQEGRAVARYDSRDGYGAHRRESTYVATDGAATGYLGCSPGVGAAIDSGGVP
jgi:endonuclease YncB( thermonuclease family)